MKNIMALLSGAVFGIGLSVSGMVNPKKVIGFLDIAGSQTPWDAALVFVMGGAVVIGLAATHLIRMRQNPVCDSQFHMPNNKLIDNKLVSGAALFGIGWGVAGICPGPALVNIVQLNSQIFAFIASMLIGQFIVTKIVK